LAENLAVEFEQTILAQRLMNLDAKWADEVVFPYYEGLSIRNLAHTIMKLLESRPSSARLGSAPLDKRLWEPYWGTTKRVILFISDGLGWRLLQEVMAADAITAQVVADLVGDGTLTPITSVTPSTTAAALPSIWTGASPAATGMVGTRLFLREFSLLADMLHYWPVVGKHRAEILEEWGLDFASFMPIETLAEALNEYAVPTTVLLEKSLFGSGLSRIMHRGIRQAVRHFGYTDLWITLRELLRATRGQKCLVHVYWAAVDGISHLYGTAAEQSITEVRRQLTDLRDMLLLENGIGDGHTLLMFAADHGHSPVPDYINVMDHKPLADTLRSGLGGDGRFAHLYLRHDSRSQAIDYIQTRLAKRALAFDPADALKAGLFGSETPHPETPARLGDLTVLMREGAVIADRASSQWTTVSRHAGMSKREMLVPLIMRLL